MWQLDASCRQSILHFLPLIESRINFKAIFDELAKLEHEPRLIIEVKNKAAVGEVAEWLKRFIP